ncbi:trafficking protein particle complex subunit 10 [Geosmithia morbida]|uniref:Trafficking protein particle complex subunit 10 n=1 Tax=Geosmithia morbida TaxID=1094350 RepID=A0A9P4Z5E8_9HYPO|nr:trafficking protein particle complex subunit 10 [Geosmithia morbida]KAF4127019.1 trafficking protein particle complex subunit 10 [Geosmithia morbida]
MEQQNASSSKVTVEYHDPHDVYKLLAPGLIPRLPLHDLHWKSHSGPLRSIETLHVDLVRGGAGDEQQQQQPTSSSTLTPTSSITRRSNSTARDDGFQTQSVGGRAPSSETAESSSQAAGPTAFGGASSGGRRRHQIPGLRRTPYLKALLVRCDDNDSYKNSVRSEVREWIKNNTPPSSGSKRGSNQERHDAYEWVIVHVVIPNTAAATQPRSASAKLESGTAETKTTSRWRTGSTPLLDKFRSDFNGSSKSAVDRITQIRIGINDVPYDHLPRVVPAVPTGYSETEQDAEHAWAELIAKFKSLILTSFDKRVTQYEEDIKEKDSQRTLPGWNFCTFFILKEGLAQGFENVGLVEDALVGYDELSVGLDSVVKEQAEASSPAHNGGVLLGYTEAVRKSIENIISEAQEDDGNDEEAVVDLQQPKDTAKEQFDEIPISSTKKPYRDLILANNVSVFDFRCYIFSRQIALLLRLGNAQSTREELLAKLKEQQASILHGVAPQAPPPQKKTTESENLSRLAEICRRTLEFIPAVSSLLRQDIITALEATVSDESSLAERLGASKAEVIDNTVASFAFSVAQQILAQTSTKAVPIPPSTLPPVGEEEPKASIPEPKTMMHPSRTSSLNVRPTQRPPPSPNVFAGRSATLSDADAHNTHHLRAGLEELAAKRADLYLLSRSILNGLGKKRGWSNGWDHAPLIGEVNVPKMQEVSLDDDNDDEENVSTTADDEAKKPSTVGINSKLLRTAVDNPDDFYRLYEILTDKSLRHFIVSGHDYSVHADMSDLAVLKFYLKEYRAATSFFCQTTPFFGDSGWSWLELSMLVMYTRCLQEIKSKEYVRVALKLLTKACAAEEERWRRVASSTSTRVKAANVVDLIDMSAISEVVGSITDLAASTPVEAQMPLLNFATDVELTGPPVYHDSRDSCELAVSLRSLLPGDLKIDSAALRVSCTNANGPFKELLFKAGAGAVLSRGHNTIKLECKSVIPGDYKVDHLSIVSGNLVLHYDRNILQKETAPNYVFRKPYVRLYQRAGAFDVELVASKHTSLDKSNCLDLIVRPGWNSLSKCEIRVKPATGGLRLLMTEAKLVGSEGGFAKPPESGVFHLNPVGAGKTVTVRFPFTVENDVGVVAAKLEATYKTDSDPDSDSTFHFAKSQPVSVALALNVNVQDVFKHESLFSRFSVTTATRSPLRLFGSELQGTKLFESTSGRAPSGTVIVFAKQPATFLYKIKRTKTGDPSKPDGPAKKAEKTMYLKLYYSQVDSEVEEVIRLTISKALEQTSLAPLQRAIEAVIIGHVRAAMDGPSLERAALLGEIPMGFLLGIKWREHFGGLGKVPGTKQDIGATVSAFFEEWLSSHRRVSLPSGGVMEKASIMIPVEVQSISVVHTADMRLNLTSGQAAKQVPPPPTAIVTIGQVVPATVHLRWTRRWDTSATGPSQDKEFSYEVAAPPEAWLLGGRRKGHFVIPGTAANDPSSSSSSTAETEADIPLTLIAQREGHLAYPGVEIREIGPDGEPLDSHAQSFELDFRNLGETIHVVGGRHHVTVSLDASGPGGQPLVLSGERMNKGERIVA